MVCDAINADYTAIAAKADALKRILETGKTVHITCPAGTDLTIALDGKRAYPNVGMPAHSDQFMSRQASLPGGDVIVVSVESSASSLPANQRPGARQSGFDSQRTCGLKVHFIAPQFTEFLDRKSAVLST
jgi:leucyl aminopeptidase (aminopeptidase T)